MTQPLTRKERKLKRRLRRTKADAEMLAALLAGRTVVVVNENGQSYRTTIVR